jgi:RNA polymerase sigma-70 factor (ECF subfamily)
MHNSGTPQEWLQLAQAGDKHARAKLLNWLRQQVRSWARRLAQHTDQADASDLAQEVCLRVHNTFDRLYPNCAVAQLLGWARAILKNLVAGHGRRKAGRPHADVALDILPGHDTGPDEKARRQEHTERLRQAVQQLPEEQRLAFQLRLNDGLTFAEMGQRLGMSLGRARVLFLRAATALQEAVAGLETS